MDRNEAKQEVKRNWRALITGLTSPARQRVNGETSYICPLCGHGAHGDGLTFNRQNQSANGLKCFGCGFSGDIIDLYMKCNGSDYNTALKALADELNITIDPYKPDAAKDFAPEHAQSRQNAPEAAQPENSTVNSQTAAEQPQEGTQADYTGYYRECAGRIEQAADYLKLRGISLDTAKKHGIGYDPAADPANNPGGSGNSFYPAPRLIIPVSKKCYIARATDPAADPRYKKMFPKGSGGSDLFNTRCLYAQEAQEVFITEGAIDALSVIECGRQAAALNSANNAEKLLNILEKRPTEATLIICLDNDAAGKRAAETLSAGLQRMNISFLMADISGTYKDPNEFLTADRPQFEKAIGAAERQAAAKPDNTAAYIETLMQLEIERFKRDKKTGFSELDSKAGGLYSGLYVVAAISSLGKTTFCHQLAEQLAENGTDVLYFSLEQSRLEMVSKSLARRIVRNRPETQINSLFIRKGGAAQAAAEAAKEYIAAVEDRLSIIEGNYNCDISYIGNYIRQYIRRNNTRPVVFLDYLQILQPAPGSDRRQGIKETIDLTVTELKRLSRELDLTIIVISSVNRANYLTPIDFESLKESGGIEFTADVIWGLQLQILNDDLFNSEKKIKEKREKVKQAKAATPRKIELVCLKNRYGISNYSVNFSYYPAIDLFKEDTDFTPDVNGENPFNGESTTEFNPRRK